MAATTNEPTKEYRVYGPPGTGKTTWITERVTAYGRKHGGQHILLTSLTRAAAQELAGRELDIPPENIGTLHAHCFRALRKPVIAETRIGEWNAQNPQFAVSVSRGKARDMDDGAEEPQQQAAGSSDELWDRMNLYRVRMVPMSEWDSLTRRFGERWKAWKESRKLLDFTDLLERALEEGYKAPGEPSIIVVDEAQDHAPLELALIRAWSKYVDTLVIVGDPDQAIFTWRGADPRAFQTPAVPNNRRKVLSQSHRIPAAVHDKAQDWIRQIRDREDVSYRPRPVAGEYRRARHTYLSPEELIAEAVTYTAEGKEAMILATCSYMLEPAIRHMRTHGIPFANRYRVKNGLWNPIRHGSSQRNTSTDRVLSFLKASPRGNGQMWTAADVRTFAEILAAKGTMRHGMKTALASITSNDPISLKQLYEWFEPDVADRLIQSSMDSDPTFLRDYALAAKRSALEYPCSVFARGGLSALLDAPRITVGTIHSVKGGQADRVYLFPDLSQTQFVGYNLDEDDRQLIVRTFYVGMTRARESLVICEPSSRLACMEL